MACLNPWDVQTARIFGTDGAFHTLFANGKVSGVNRDGILDIRKRASRRVAEDCRADSARVGELTDADEARQ